MPAGLRRQDESYQRPAIGGFPGNPRWRSYIFDDVHSICHALQEASYLGAKPRFRTSPTTLYTQFASRKLRYLRCMARGDTEGANWALTGA